MQRSIRQIISIFVMAAMFIGLTSCGVLDTGTTEYNDLVALVQGVQVVVKGDHLNWQCSKNL